jgi:hypothetical protein
MKTYRDMKQYLEALEASVNTLTEEQVLEFIGHGTSKTKPVMQKVDAGMLTPKAFPELGGEVFTLSTRSPIVQGLCELLGVPEDGTAYKIRTGFMQLDKKNSILFFAKSKRDLPGYIGQGWDQRGSKE